MPRYQWQLAILLPLGAARGLLALAINYQRFSPWPGEWHANDRGDSLASLPPNMRLEDKNQAAQRPQWSPCSRPRKQLIPENR